MRTVIWIVDFLLVLPILVMVVIFVKSEWVVDAIMFDGKSVEKIASDINSIYYSSGTTENGYFYSDGGMIHLENGKNYFLKQLKQYSDIEKISTDSHAWFMISEAGNEVSRTAVIYGKPDVLNVGDSITIQGEGNELDAIIEQKTEGDWKLYAETVNRLDPEKFLLVYREDGVAGVGKYTIFLLTFPPSQET